MRIYTTVAAKISGVISCSVLLILFNFFSASAQHRRFAGNRSQIQRRSVNRSQSRPGLQQTRERHLSAMRSSGQRASANHSQVNRRTVSRASTRNVSPANHHPAGWAASRPAYSRPPHIYGGRRYYTYHSYFYHPYRPFFFGPTWHPVGFFLAGYIYIIKKGALQWED